MKRILSLGFEFHDKFYYLFVKVIDKEACTEYLVTLMNSSLNEILTDNIIINEINGYLTISTFKDTIAQKDLKMCIAKELSEFIHVPLININTPNYDNN